jgi:hypothetical protein
MPRSIFHIESPNIWGTTVGNAVVRSPRARDMCFPVSFHHTSSIIGPTILEKNSNKFGNLFDVHVWVLFALQPGFSFYKVDKVWRYRTLRCDSVWCERNLPAVLRNFGQFLPEYTEVTTAKTKFHVAKFRFICHLHYRLYWSSANLNRIFLHKIFTYFLIQIS